MLKATYVARGPVTPVFAAPVVPGPALGTPPGAAPPAG